jgi:hypothetical protein
MQAFNFDQMIEKLRECEQFELIKTLESVTHDVTRLEKLSVQLSQIDQFYDGGLKSYVMKVN